MEQVKCIFGKSCHDIFGSISIPENNSNVTQNINY